jgi:Ca2+-transporting ATPase
LYPLFHYDKNVRRGLTSREVEDSRLTFGSNLLDGDESRPLFRIIRGVALEPMFLFLLAGCIIYFVLGANEEGIVMIIALLLVSGISIFQEVRSHRAVAALNKLSAARARVIRGGIEMEIPSEEIVNGDLLLISEGEVVSADGLILEARDLFINESILTGESFPVHKTGASHQYVYKGTLVSSGSALVQVTSVGKDTQFGKIGLSLATVVISKTPLQRQIASFVRNMAIVGSIAFILVFLINYLRSPDLIMSLLAALTLAMSILPEEIPVAFSTFQALGAYRLLRHGIIVKHPQHVETLGSATVICADKTGTITQNLMRIACLYDALGKATYNDTQISRSPLELVSFAMWASESSPFDPMEKEIHSLYERIAPEDLRSRYRQVHEYPLGGIPPFMTHIFMAEAGQRIIAAKGAPESILHLSDCNESERKSILQIAASFAKQGYRVLGVGKGHWNETHWPVSQEEFSFQFLGLIAFEDPPKEAIGSTISAFERAGIQFKMITGDYPETAVAIARQIGMDHSQKVLTGKEVMEMDEKVLGDACCDTRIFARMFPEAKLRIIDALKKKGEIVAMTGDGVNDAPALKAAHIGIAMGKRGSEVAKNAASLVLTDDDLTHMVDAIALGRKIYDNLKKAIRYIISIHIPIILLVLLPLLLGWTFTNIFSPVHVIFLELIMGPTCSIIYEHEPIESGTMERAPRKFNTTFLSLRQLFWSIIQGLAITAICLGLGYYYLTSDASRDTVRTMIFITLLFCNIFLTLINRSFRLSVFTTWQYRNPLMVGVIMITSFLIFCLTYFDFLRDLFQLTSLSVSMALQCCLAGLAGTIWFEAIKMKKIL